MSSVEQSCKALVHTTTRCTPNVVTHDAYAEFHAVCRQLYSDLRERFAQLRGIDES